MAVVLVLTDGVPAQDIPADLEASVLAGMSFRPIGPFRGGRSAAVAGVAGKPMRHYFGGTGGGVWRTDDGGASWTNISDGFFGGSIGAVAVSDADPNVLYVGGGEKTVRGNVSHGDGLWRSTDAGKTWKFVGLDDTRHIPRIRIHPRDPEIVYVAALGHLSGPNQQRGVFRSRDGGQSWERVLFIHEEVGAVDLVLDPGNPRILYATFWRVKRTPYSLESGGEGSGLWKSTDGGDTWQELTRRPGLPQGTVGIIGVAVSPLSGDRVWAQVEADDGGLFRSDDGGSTWSQVNSDRNLRQRAWYYTRIYAGPKNIDELYVLNVGCWRSRDGGRSFTSIDTPHGDHHDLWIDPEDPEHLIVGDDGGAQVSYNGGTTWSSVENQPTAQFYRVTTDNHFPYRIYGAQQDNSTVRIRHRSDTAVIGDRDWEPSAGGESGHLAVDPRDPEIVYGGSYGGLLVRRNHRTGEERSIDVWPENSIGHGAGANRYRFQWNFPIFFSPHDARTLYAAANVLFKTTNEGQSWTAISPDLTRNDASKLLPSGGPITKDNTSVEYYCTIFAAVESPHEPGVLWVGSDDGLLHLSRDGGGHWTNVTPPQMPEWAQINSLEPHPTEKGGLYLAATRYKLDDLRPYLFRSLDYGQTWQLITAGIDRQHFTRVVRADPHRPGLLFCGTERGLYLSWDQGDHWRPLRCNLPVVPITDLAIKNGDLIVATQGRSFWVLDDLSPLRQLRPELGRADIHLFTPRTAYRQPGGSTSQPPRTAGQNPPAGVVAYFHLGEKPSDEKPLSLEILDAAGARVRRFSTQPQNGEELLAAQPGLNRFVWDLRYPPAENFPGVILWMGGTQGPTAVPGTYQLKLDRGDQSQVVACVLEKDPRVAASIEDLAEQFRFLREIRDKLSETHRAIRQLRDVRDQLAALAGRLGREPAHEDLRRRATELQQRLTAVEEALYQTKNQSPQDPLNFPIRLNNKLSALASLAAVGDARPTEQSIAVQRELTGRIDAELAKLREILGPELTAFNQLVREQNVPAIFPGGRD